MSNRNWIRKKRRYYTWLNHPRKPMTAFVQVDSVVDLINRRKRIDALVEQEDAKRAANPPLPVKAQSYEGRYIDVATINLATSLFGPLLMKAAHRRTGRD